jgi:hypothetical protein
MANSSFSHVGDGTKTAFSMAFKGGYLDSSHVEVYVDDLLIDTGFNFDIENVLTFDTAPAVDAKVFVRRRTPTTNIYSSFSYANMAKPTNMNIAFNQVLMAVQEIEDGYNSNIEGDGLGVTYLPMGLDMSGGSLTGLSVPTLDSDAVTKSYLDDSVAGLSTYVDDALVGLNGVSYATETVAGTVEKLTDAEFAVGTDDTRYVTAKQVTSALGTGAASMQVFTASGTYTPTTGMRTVKVTVVGGGGGGQLYNFNTHAGACGGGGGCAIAYLTAALVGASLTVTVGAGGSKGAGGNGPVAGAAGGTSSLGAHVVATGGNGGGVSPDDWSGGAGGVGTAGQLLFGGSFGTKRFERSDPSGTSSDEIFSSIGGGSFLGGSVANQSGHLDVASGNYGVGGLGSTTGNADPQDGSAGVIIIEEFF